MKEYLMFVEKLTITDNCLDGPSFNYRLVQRIRN